MNAEHSSAVVPFRGQTADYIITNDTVIMKKTGLTA
jgi:hypothetical protein